MKAVLRILRYDPETDNAPHFEDYGVEADPGERLLDALMRVKRSIDPTLSLRKSCAHGVCGSDAMVINGTERLACRTLVGDALTEGGGVIRIEPLKALPVQKDLMVDLEKFYIRYRKVKPYLINETPSPRSERLQSPEEREKIDDPTKCILCAACFSSCPVENETNPEFIGPAAIVQAARFVFDSRDTGLELRLDPLDGDDGVRACENKFNCTRVCPRSIKVTKNINLTKNRIRDFKEGKK